jgi:CheY-like chemotaxis protein
MSLPGLSGLGLARQFRHQPGMKHALLVCISGYGWDADVEKSWTAGCEHLVKAVDAADILRLLARSPEPST